MGKNTSGLQIKVRGIVQGVGFRPFIYQLATRLDLSGWVRNTSSGVEIEVAGPKEILHSFVLAIQSEKPPLARIDHIDVQDCPPAAFPNFSILASQAETGQFIPVSPDYAICPDCQTELFDPANRRYHYPFINCTNCGPRFSIILDIPYDRPKTTMAGFEMCPECRAEYENPLDRRFHAQPIACPRCGPQVSFVVAGKTLAQRAEALRIARRWLKDGKILAVKGLGGYHLACDSTNPVAVETLRQRKKRSDKPFALMAFDLAAIERHAQVSPAEAALLSSIQRPIVLLPRRIGSPISPAAAPFQNTLGFMQAYTPLHLLLLDPAGAGLDVLVMTSGNLSEEPIAYRDDDALDRLADLADAFLIHDRPIHMRVDDSVAQVVLAAPYLLRRSRGFAPDSLHLPFETRPLLATGTELKNTFCLAQAEYAFLSHHIGDMENYETLQSFEEGILHYQNLFRVQPQAIACDLHPNYLATRYAVQRAAQASLPLFQVQHHHAHLAACLADNGWTSDQPVIGLSYDGTGFGTDAAIWGGEVLVGSYAGYRRAFHLKYSPLPGGDSATRSPARIALAQLWSSGMDWEPDLPPVAAVCESDRTLLRSIMQHHINCPSTSSMGRFFDAAAALLGVRQQATYEGQAAIELEALVDPAETGFYEFQINPAEFDPAPLWLSLLADWRAGLSIPKLAARFHNSIALLNLTLCRRLQQEYGIQTVALSGGVWQNRVLLEKSVVLLKQAGFTVLTHHQVPTNDGGVSLGQVAVAAWALAHSNN